MKRKLIKGIIAMLILAATFVSGYSMSKPIPQQPYKSIKIEQTQIDYSEVIIKEIRSVNKIIFAETPLYQEMNLKSPFQNAIMKNNLKIPFTATGYSAVNLRNSQIYTNDNTKEIIIHTQKPEVVIDFDEINIDEYIADQGVAAKLIGAEYQVRPIEYENAKASVRADMIEVIENKSNGFENYIEESIQETIKNLTGLNYDVKVVFVN